MTSHKSRRYLPTWPPRLYLAVIGAMKAIPKNRSKIGASLATIVGTAVLEPVWQPQAPSRSFSARSSTHRQRGWEETDVVQRGHAWHGSWHELLVMHGGRGGWWGSSCGWLSLLGADEPGTCGTL